MGNGKKRSPTRQNSSGNKIIQPKPNTSQVDRVKAAEACLNSAPVYIDPEHSESRIESKVKMTSKLTNAVIVKNGITTYDEVKTVNENQVQPKLLNSLL